jgi:hypothetical protein
MSWGCINRNAERRIILAKDLSDAIVKLCQALNVESNDIYTFEQFIESEFNIPFAHIKNTDEVMRLRRAWNISCESLLQVLNGLKLLSRGKDHGRC